MAKKKKVEDRPYLTAAIYARYSSSVQNDASIEQQIAECEDYAKQNNLIVIERYEDRAISGKKDNRPGLQRMLRAADQHKFQVLIAYKSNRISRNMGNALSYEERLFKAGVKVVYCKEEFGDNATGRFMLRTMMNMNQFYSENMAEDIRRGLRDSAQKCKVVSTIPYGYKKGPDGKYALDEMAASVVEEIFRRFVEDESYADIARELNSRGILTKQKKPWGKNSFHSILVNERYTGTYIYDDIRIEGGMPKIIERGVYELAQQKLDRHQETRSRHRDNEDYLLTGKLFCGHCLGAMVGLSGRGRWGNDYFYYACQTRRIQKTCQKKNVKKDLIEEEVTRAVLECVLDEATIVWIADTAVELAKERNAHSQLAEYQERLAETNKQIANIVKAVEVGMPYSEVKDRMDELHETKKQLTGLIEVEKATATHIDRAEVIVYLETIKRGNVKDKKFQRKIIHDFIRAVYLYDDHFKLSVDFTGENKLFEYPFRASEAPETTVESVENKGSGVCITPAKVYHYILIQTPDPRNHIEVSDTGFVVVWYFSDKQNC